MGSHWCQSFQDSANDIEMPFLGKDIPSNVLSRCLRSAQRQEGERNRDRRQSKEREFLKKGELWGPPWSPKSSKNSPMSFSIELLVGLPAAPNPRLQRRMQRGLENAFTALHGEQAERLVLAYFTSLEVLLKLQPGNSFMAFKTILHAKQKLPKLPYCSVRLKHFVCHGWLLLITLGFQLKCHCFCKSYPALLLNFPLQALNRPSFLFLQGGRPLPWRPANSVVGSAEHAVYVPTPRHTVVGQEPP